MTMHDELAAVDRSRLSPDTLFVDVKFRAQSNANLCGVASMHMLTDFYKKPVPVSEWEQLATAAELQNGLTGLQLKEAFSRQGFSAFILKGDLGETISGASYHLKRSHPVLVMLRKESQMKNFNHMVLMVGLDTIQQKVIFLDPLHGQTILKTELFNKLWQNADSFMLIAIPREGVMLEKSD